ncbi:hypothetical protein Tco_0052741 [Tanacetum coccineum]
MRVEESLNVKFDESPPPKSPPLEDDDVLECENVKNQEKDLEIKEKEPLNKEIINIKESKYHPLETVIAVNIDLIELLFFTPPTSPQALFDTLEDLPTTTNPPPLWPSFDSFERLANEPPPLLAMEPPLPPLPPQLLTFPQNPPSKLPPLGPNNHFPLLTHQMFCEHCQRTQVVVDNLWD